MLCNAAPDAYLPVAVSRLQFAALKRTPNNAPEPAGATGLKSESLYTHRLERCASALMLRLKLVVEELTLLSEGFCSVPAVRLSHTVSSRDRVNSSCMLHLRII